MATKVLFPYSHDVQTNGVPIVPWVSDAHFGLVPIGDPNGNSVAISIADQATFTAASTPGNPIEGVYESTPSTVPDGKLGVVGIDANRNLKVTPAPLSKLLDAISSYFSTDALMNGGVALTPKFKTISTAASGASTGVAAVTSKKIRVLAYVVVASAAVNLKFQSHTTPTDLTGLLYMAANGGVSSGFNPLGWFESLSGEALDLNLSAAIAIGGHLIYVEV